MTKAIEKILKNFVFEDGDVPEIEIELLKTPELGKTLYVVTAVIPEDSEIHNSEGLADDIMEKMETALSLLGFTSVHGNMISKKGVLYIRALGHYK